MRYLRLAILVSGTKILTLLRILCQKLTFIYDLPYIWFYQPSYYMHLHLVIL